MRFQIRLIAGVVGAVLLVGLALAVLLLPHYRIIDSAMSGTADKGAEVYLTTRSEYVSGTLVTIRYGNDVFTRRLLGYKPDGTLITSDASGKPEVHPGSDGKPVALKSVNIIGEVVLVVPHGREVTIVVFFLLLMVVGWCFLSTIDFGNRSNEWDPEIQGTYPR